MPVTERKYPEALSAHRCKAAEFERQTYRVYPEKGTTVEDLLRRDYWAHIGRTLRPMDKIEAVAEDGTFYAEYLVLGCDRLWAKVHLLCAYDLTTHDVAATQADKVAEDNYVIRHVPAYKWCVLTKPKALGQAPGYLQKECATKEDATSWLRQHIKSVTA